MVTLALVGDVMLGRKVNAALGKMSPQEPWGDVMPLLHSTDLRLINLECAVTDHEGPWSRTRKVFHFRANPSRAIQTLRAARIDACSLANNHTLDFEELGLLDTIEHLDSTGIGHAGAGSNLEEAVRPALLCAGPERVALLSFTDNEPPFAATADSPGTNYLTTSLEPDVLRRVEEGVAAAREAGAGTVVFSDHRGPNMVARPRKSFREFARAVIERGADVYYGHSAHAFQGVEIYHGKPILHDTGDFIDDYAVDERLRNDRSFLFRVSLEEDEFRRLELFPVSLDYARTRLAVGEEREEILHRMQRLSAEMGTVFFHREDALVLECD